MLLSNIGLKPYGVLCSLAVLKIPVELKYADVVKILKDYYRGRNKIVKVLGHHIFALKILLGH